MKRPEGANRIWLLRCQQMLSQEELAAQVPCTREYISQIERGKKVPSLDVLDRLATILRYKPRRVSLLLRPVLEKKRKNNEC